MVPFDRLMVQSSVEGLRAVSVSNGFHESGIRVKNLKFSQPVLRIRLPQTVV